MRPHPSRQRGLAALELALLLPLLLMLLFGIIDAARAIQANVIMVNLSREGANLVSRGSTDLASGHQDILYALMSSAPPLKVNQQGMVYITRVMGVVSGTTKRSIVLEQYRWDDVNRKLGFNVSGYNPSSRVYTCSAWTSGVCSSISSKAEDRKDAGILTGQLEDGEVVYVVETFYKFDMLLSKAVLSALQLPTYGPDLYSMSVF